MSYDPMPASGAGEAVFDAPSLFYLTNRPVIEEWYNLRSNVAQAVGEWFQTTVKDALALEGAKVGLEVAIARGPGSYHHLVLHPPDATVLGTKPVIGIGFAWPSKTVNPAADSVFACVRCSRNQTGQKAAEVFLESGGHDLRKNLGGHSDPTWLIWWWVRADPQWWTALDAYRDLLVSEVMRLAEAAREPLEAASRVPILDGTAEEE